jgi:hypothetical protein
VADLAIADSISYRAVFDAASRNRSRSLNSAVVDLASRDRAFYCAVVGLAFRNRAIHFASGNDTSCDDTTRKDMASPLMITPPPRLIDAPGWIITWIVSIQERQELPWKVTPRCLLTSTSLVWVGYWWRDVVVVQSFREIIGPVTLPRRDGYIIGDQILETNIKCGAALFILYPRSNVIYRTSAHLRSVWFSQDPKQIVIIPQPLLHGPCDKHNADAVTGNQIYSRGYYLNLWYLVIQVIYVQP